MTTEESNTTTEVGSPSTVDTVDTAAIVAIGGGKGRCGKSVIASNLASMLASINKRVVVVDAVSKQPSLHGLFGISNVEPGLESVFETPEEDFDLSELLQETTVPRVQLITATGLKDSALERSYRCKQEVLRQLRALDVEMVIVDCGSDELDFFNLADKRLLVTGTQLNEIQDGYRFIRRAVVHLMRNTTKDEREFALLRSVMANQDRISVVIKTLQQDNFGLTAALEASLFNMDVSLLGNMASSPRDRAGLHAAQRMVKDFLSIQVPVVAMIPNEPQVVASVASGQPFVVGSSYSSVARELAHVAESILELDVQKVRSIREREASLDIRRPSIMDRSLLRKDQEPRGKNHYKRAHTRIAVHWNVNVTFQKMKVPGVVHDISRGGVAMESEAKLRRDDPVAIQVLNLGSEPTFQGIVKQVEADSNVVGIAFDDRHADAKFEDLIATALNEAFTKVQHLEEQVQELEHEVQEHVALHEMIRGTLNAVRTEHGRSGKTRDEVDEVDAADDTEEENGE